MENAFKKEFEMIEEVLQELALRSKITIFLDENLLQLQDALKAYGFKIVTLPIGTKDEDIKEMASGWLILTRNSQDFIKDALVYDYDVVAIEGIKFIDTDKTRNNQTVKKVHQAINDSKISQLRGNFVLKIKDDGKWTVEILNEKIMR